MPANHVNEITIDTRDLEREGAVVLARTICLLVEQRLRADGASGLGIDTHLMRVVEQHVDRAKGATGGVVVPPSILRFCP